MLIQFNFNNYRSFKNEAVLDMSATKITEHPNHVAEVGKEKILKVAAIYGANASGKSNVFSAFDYMTEYVVNSFKFGGDSDIKQNKDNEYIKVSPFLFDSTSKNEPSTFEVFFVDNSNDKHKTFQYGFSVNSQEVLEEWLYTKAKTSSNYKTIFYRKKGEETDYSGIKKSSDNIEIALEKESLIVSLGAKLKIEILKTVREWFLKNEIVDFGNPGENFLRSRLLPYNFDEDKDVQKKVVKFFSSFDESIKDFLIETDGEIDDKEKDGFTIKTLHAMNDSNEMESLNFMDESSGTLKMFSLYPPIQSALELGSLLFVDEFNSRLHPLLVRNIIQMFENPKINKNNAQLIFTTHDVWQLSNDLLRRDEIWFSEKDRNGISWLYSLVEFQDKDGEKIRKDESYGKNYIIGKYGAIPKLKPLDMFKGD
ncbi:AAA family ATPase [Proteocatella sphenisci]|uniref:AAA family ATPase n=1 Tax=Proteocatella sphenisci TaxID=181070 RepID=UPI000490A49E|nr:ATP-binding protein [Proteocatella sphenisci]